MGARPALALSVLAVPATGFPHDITAGILRGAAAMCAEAGVVIAGGHSIDDAEPKFGLVALGFAHPRELWRKSGAEPGDTLVLGKALGSGVISTAIKRDAADQPAIRAAIRSMRQLNAEAAAIAVGHQIHAMTDVSGFGLMGHLREMCEASEVSARILAGAPRLLPDAEALAGEGFVPGGTRRNRDSVALVVDWDEDVPSVLRDLLCDAQTSGGLLAALPSSDASSLAAEWEAAGYAASVIGRIGPPDTATIVVEP
jgi:selenide,water dikinase